MAGSTDTVPARLTPGEFVIKRESAEMLGLPLLEQLNSVSNGAAHDNIDALIAEATLSQMQPMAGGGYVGNQNIASYQDGGAVDDTLTAEDLAFMNMSQDVSGVKSYLNPNIVFGEDYKNMSAEKLNKSAENFRDLMYLFKDIATEDAFFDFSPLAPGLGGRFNMNDASSLDDLVHFLSHEEGVGSDAFKRLLKTHDDFKDSNKLPLIKDFYDYGLDMDDKPFKPQGYQFGGSVSDNTATSAMDALIAQAEIAQALKKKPQSRFSMVDADRVDAENQELMEMILSMAIPGAGVAGTAKGVTGKLPKLAKKIASMRPDKGKQAVLDKIASAMKVAPGRKIEQTSKDWLLSPASKKLDMDKIKGYRVLENTLNKPFDKMDLVNPGYLQKFTNELVKVRDKPHLKLIGGKDVRVGDVVDALYNRGFLNENELKRIGKIIPKKYRKDELKELLDLSKGASGKISGYQDGGEVDSLFNMSMEDFNKILANELLKSYETGENMPERIERTKEEDEFFNNPTNPYGNFLIDDLLKSAFDRYRFGQDLNRERLLP